MDMFTKTLHHLSVRKRVHENLEEYPHPNAWKNRLDKLIYIVGASGPIMTMPQAYLIWVTKDASGLSFLTWGWYFLVAIIWLIYALIHKEKPLILTNLLWIIIYAIILLEIIAFG